MRRPYLVCAVAGLAAILAIAACQGYQPPTSASAATRPATGCGPVCCVPSGTQGCCVMMPAAPAAKVGVTDLLDKLEALKARREAIEREERETHAVLKERLREQQERLNKLNHGTPTPVPPAGYAPTTSYAPLAPVPPPNYGIPAPGPSYGPVPATPPVPTPSSN